MNTNKSIHVRTVKIAWRSFVHWTIYMLHFYTFAGQFWYNWLFILNRSIASSPKYVWICRCNATITNNHYLLRHRTVFSICILLFQSRCCTHLDTKWNKSSARLSKLNPLWTFHSKSKSKWKRRSMEWKSEWATAYKFNINIY